MPNRTFVLQLGIIAVCIAVVAQLAGNFPFPSPFISPLLPPNQRWPAAEVAGWIEAQNYSPGFLEFFGRDPERTIPSGKNIVSPADGVVTAIPELNSISYLTIGLSFWDVHVVRTPVEGTVTDVTEEGLTLFRNSSEIKDQVYLKGKDAPVQQIVTFDSAYGKVRVRLITSYWASRLKVWVHPGDRLKKGERIGRILLGSSVVAEFQGKVHFDVRPNERVVGGETVIFRGEQLE